MRTAALFTMTSFYALVFFFVLSVILIYLSPKRWHGLLTVFLGLLTACIDVQSSEVSFTILLVISFGFFLGFTKPSTPLRTGFLLTVWLPLAAFVHLVAQGNESAFLTEGVGTFIAFIPAIGGSYLGALIRNHAETSTQVKDVLI